MARRVFFSFHWDRDNWRIGVVRNSWVTKKGTDTIVDAADWETVKKSGRREIQNWIDNQLNGTGVTVVLIGAETSTRKWVQYEIAQSVAKKKGLLGIRINRVDDPNKGKDTAGANPLPSGCAVYDWIADDGYNNIETWVETAAKAAGR